MSRYARTEAGFRKRKELRTGAKFLFIFRFVGLYPGVKQVPSPTPRPGTSVLDWRMPIWLRVVLVCACAFVPTDYMVNQYEAHPDLTQLPLFARNRQAGELPQLKALHPVTDSPGGYDGQFYAQLALDPALRQPELRQAIDDPHFRGQRILMPVLAWCLGLGRPGPVLFAYALLNLLFWYLLLGVLLAWMRAASPRDFLAIFAIMLTSGALVSIERALTDLPAAALGTFSLMAGEMSGAALIAAAILTKPTSGLFLLRYAISVPRTFSDLGGRVFCLAIALVPMALWLCYLHHAFYDPQRPPGLVWPFDLPFRGMVERIPIFWQAIVQTPVDVQFQNMTGWEWQLFALLTLGSLVLQALYLIVQPRWSDRFWLVGAGFAVMFLCLSSGELVEELNFDRTVLTLTVAFNIVLWRYTRGLAYGALFALGNGGLILHFHDMIVFLYSRG